MRLKTIFKIVFLINLIAIFGVMFIIDAYQKSTLQLQKAYELQHKSLILADELRQSSDDLTRMARTYVVTGKDMFETQFHKVLDIRNGTIPRPQNYNRIYWDFLTLEGSVAKLDGLKKSLRQMMQEADFSQEELAMLLTSAKESDNLTHLETKAMNAVKGIFQDENGEYTKKDRPDLLYATQIMHSDEYHRAKIAIMKPLDKFYESFETRTKQNVQRALERVNILGKIVSFAIIALILLVLLSFFILLSRIVYPLENLKHTMMELSRNNMDVLIPNRYINDEVGDMIKAIHVFKDNALRLIQKEEKLKSAVVQAKEANNSKSVFLANMSHELRTPLNAILGFANILKKSKNLNQKEMEYLDLISSSGKHLLTIINEILELSKIEVGKIEIKKEHFDFYTMIEDVKMMFASRCQTKQLEFNINLHKDVPKYAFADEKRIKQILINLIGNSLKFTKQGYIYVDIRYENRKIFCEVHDTGIGILKENQKKIFIPFEQVSNKDLNASGTGLGLSITKQLIKLMKGKIHVKSEIGKGSHFYFDIELEFSSKDKLQRKDYINKNELNIFDKTVLIADDKEINRTLISEYLRMYGCNVIEAKDGNEVLSKVAKEHIELIFLDLLMPNLDGFETMKILQSKKEYSNIPIIVVSANVFEEDKEKAFSCGASDFLEKPIDENILESLLIKYFNDQITSTNNKLTKFENEFLDTLYDLAKKLDAQLIYELLNKSSIDERQKESIKKMVNNFEFDKILQIK